MEGDTERRLESGGRVKELEKEQNIWAGLEYKTESSGQRMVSWLGIANQTKIPESLGF